MTGTRNPYQSRDGGRRGASRRGIVALILILLLPPIGLIYLWRLGVFQTRGRVLLTALAFVEMMLLFSWGLFGLISWNSLPPTDAPVAGAAAAVTPYPDDETINALSNIDALIAAGVTERDENELVVTTPEPVLTQEEQREMQREILDTEVYAVYSGAKLYHAQMVCGNQSNRRALTVEQAMQEGLAACPNCNPPVLGSTMTGGDALAAEEDTQAEEELELPEEGEFLTDPEGEGL